MISAYESLIAERFKSKGKFVSPTKTAKDEDRAFVEFQDLTTLWFNTGTRCNLACEHCYIESSPYNDALEYLSFDEVSTYLDEIEALKLNTQKIAFTGGEPFLNKDLMLILADCLHRGYEVLVLTNAYRAIDKYIEPLKNLASDHSGKIQLRVSLDHYTRKEHEKERGSNTFNRTLSTIRKLMDLDLNISIAGRSLTGESPALAEAGYQELMQEHDIHLKLDRASNLVLFPEMSPERDVPEITTGCWDILNVSPHAQMCAHERMVVKRKGADKPVVLPCTLITYDVSFELGHTLEESFQKVYLNHPYCAQFCILGGASCSA